MIRFEIKKIFSRPAYKISLALLMAITCFYCYLAISYVECYDESGVRTGFAAAKILREEIKPWEGPITEEVLRQVLRESQANVASPEYNSQDVTQNNIAYSRAQGFAEIRELINFAFSPFREYNYLRFNSLTEADMSRFYEGRTQSLKTWLDSEETTDLFTEKEKAFLIQRYQSLETPYEYAYSEGWKAVLHWGFSLVMMTMMFISFYVSSIFSGESQCKADAIFFSTRLGRSRAVRAKVAAGFLVTSGIYWAAMALYTAVVLAVLGVGGGHCPIQTWLSGWKSFYHLSFAQLYGLTLVGGWIGDLFITGLAMLISAKTRSSVLAVSVPFIILFLPSFLDNTGIVGDILALSPEQLLNVERAASTFHLYEIGGRVVGSLPIILVGYSLLYVLILPLMYRVYQKTQVV